MDLNLFDLDDERLDDDDDVEAYAAPPAPAPAGGGDAAPATLDEQAAMLKELAGMCMEVARLTFGRVMAAETAAAQAEALPPAYVAPPAPAAPAPPAPIPGLPADAHLAFHRATRAVRTSVALWRQLEREKDLGEAKAAQARLDARRDAVAARRAKVERVVEGVAHDHFAAAMPKESQDHDAMQAWSTVCGEVRERLDEEIYGDLTRLPISEIVADICLDAGLPPDWQALAQEPWARVEIARGFGRRHPVGEPLIPFAEGWGLVPPDPSNERPKPRAESVRWRRRHEPPSEWPRRR